MRMSPPDRQAKDPDPAETTPDAFDALIASGRKSPSSRAMGETGRRPPIAEQVANRILSMVKSGNLKPGDRLPTEQQMGIALSISRPPLREALKALTLMGIVESRQGGRYTVTDLSPSRLVGPFNSILTFADYDVQEHFESRALVDLEAVRLCAMRASPRHRQRILKLAVDGRAFHDNPTAFRLLDVEFHQALYDGGGNRMISAIAQGLYDVGLDVRRTASAMPGVIETSVAQHCEVAEAILAADIEQAAQAYRRHLEHVLETTIRSMASMGAPK